MRTVNDGMTYTFKLGGVRFDIDIDESFSVTKSDASSDSHHIHYHARHELFLLGEGPLTVYTDSGPTVYKNCVVIVPAFCEHYTKRTDDYRILFSTECTGQTKNSFTDFTESSFSADVPISFEASSSIIQYIKELENLINDNNELQNEAISSLLKLIFYRIYSLSGMGKNQSSTNVNESYIILIERALGEYTSDVTLASVAKSMHLSTKQTSRIIMKFFKKPLSALLAERRLAIARELLASTDLPISEIVRRVNFRCENYFYSQFKKVYGLTPLAYRRRDRKSVV